MSVCAMIVSATIFGGTGFSNNRMDLQEKTYTLADWKNTVGGVSSVKVPAGVVVSMYENADCTGNAVFYTQDMPTLPRFNDKAQCIKVERTVTIYGDTGYRGNSMCLTVGDHNLPEWKDGVGGVSALRIGSGIRVTVYQNLDQTGKSISYTADTPTIEVNDGHSIKVEAQ